jgi:hypothetical protein
MTDPVRLYLLYIVLPLWLAAGLGDWMCHRYTHIQDNAGPKESFLHLLMLAEVGLPVLLALFFEINAMVIIIMLAMLVLHELTAWWDVSYAASRRHIPTVEQHMHSLLEVLPFAALSLVLVKHWGQFLALFDWGTDTPRYDLSLKSSPLPTSISITVIVAVLLLAVLPYVEEMLRCLRGRRRNLWR